MRFQDNLTGLPNANCTLRHIFNFPPYIATHQQFQSLVIDILPAKASRYPLVVSVRRSIRGMWLAAHSKNQFVKFVVLHNDTEACVYGEAALLYRR
jgi:hypothetical protein